MNRLALWLDNPILIKHYRSRLRWVQVLPWVAVVMVLSVGIVLWGYQYNGISGGETFGGLMALQAIILGVVGASQVGSSIGKARESGILDFHRVSPMSPSALALGFFFGAPIREYLLFLATLPFSMICVAMGRPSGSGFLQLMVPLVLASWTMHALALFNGLAWKSAKAGTRGVVGLIIFIIFSSSGMFTGFSVAAAAVDNGLKLDFFGLSFPWLAIVALEMMPPIVFFLIASARKLAAERAHPLSKPQAVVCLTIGGILAVGDLWGFRHPDNWYWPLVTLYSLIIAGMVLSVAITPTLDEFAKGVRRAAREGRTYPSAWEDRGLNRISLFCLCAVVLVTPTVIWRVVDEPQALTMNRTPLSYSLSIAIGVLVLAYFGLALQYFKLRSGKRGTIYLALFLFLIWLVPLLVGTIAMASAASRAVPGTEPEVWPVALFSLSPIAGIATSSGAGEMPGQTAAQAAALVPALVFALLFNNLVTSARRRIVREIHPESAPAAGPESKPLALAGELAGPSVS